MKSTEEIIKSTYFKKVLELIKSALPVIIYPNEAESLAVKICKLESPATPSVGREALIDFYCRNDKYNTGKTRNIDLPAYYAECRKSAEYFVDDYLASHPAGKPVNVTDEMIEKEFPERNDAGHYMEYNMARREGAKWLRTKTTGK